MGSPPTGAGRGGIREKLEVTPEMAKEAAQALIDGEGVNALVKTMNLSAPSIRKVMRSPEFTDQIKAIVRNRVARLADKMVQVLEAKLGENDLEAVKLGFKVLAVTEPEQAQSQSQGITVIMPGAAQPQEKVISTQFEVIDAVPESED